MEKTTKSRNSGKRYAALAKAARESFALQYIREVREIDPGIGGTKLWHMYKTEFCGDSPIGRDRFCRIIDEYGLKVRLRIRKPRTTDSSHGLPTYPNLIKDFIPTAADQLWVSDITYIVVMDDESHYQLKDKVFTSIDEVIAAVAVAVDFYNNRRPHMCIGMMKPSEAIN